MQRWAAAAAAAWLSVNPAGATSEIQRGTEGPFSRLAQIDDVNVTADGHEVTLSWKANQFVLEYPELPALGEHDYRWTQRTARLEWRCLSEEIVREGQRQLTLGLYVPRHQLHEDVAREGDPRYWAFVLTGRERRETPISVAAAQIEPAATTLILDRVGSGARRPDARAGLPARPLLERLAEVRAVQLRVTGAQLAMRIDFPTNSEAAAAASVIRNECRE